MRRTWAYKCVVADFHLIGTRLELYSSSSRYLRVPSSILILSALSLRPNVIVRKGVVPKTEPAGVAANDASVVIVKDVVLHAQIPRKVDCWVVGESEFLIGVGIALLPDIGYPIDSKEDSGHARVIDGTIVKVDVVDGYPIVSPKLERVAGCILQIDVVKLNRIGVWGVWRRPEGIIGWG